MIDENKYTNNFSHEPEEETIDIKKYIFRILYNWWIFAITIFFALTVVYLINRYSDKVYSVSCSVIIGQESEKYGSVESILEELSRMRRVRKTVVENELTVLKSHSLAYKTVQELDLKISYWSVGRRGIAETPLYKNSPFTVVLDTTKPNTKGIRINVIILDKQKYILTVDEPFKIAKTLKFGEPFNHDAFNFTIYYNDSINNNNFPKKFYFIINNLTALANYYKNALKVELNDERGSIANLTLTGKNPLLITEYLNKLCEVYIKNNLEEKNLTSENTIKFIDEQLKSIVDSLNSAGLRLQNFRTANRVINLSSEGNILFQRMEQLQSQKAMLDLNKRYFDYLVSYLSSKQNFNDIIAPSVAGINDQLLTSIISNLNSLNQQYRSLSFSVKETSPQLQLLKSEIENLRNTLQENLKNLISNNKIAIQEIDRRIKEAEAEMKKLPITERQYISIQREFNINDQIYTFLLQKRAEAGIAKASNRPDHKILDIAKLENVRRIKPKTSNNYMIGLMIAIFIPLLILIIIEYFNNKITDPKDIANKTPIPIAGYIGHTETKSDLPVFENPRSSLAESFRSLRTNLQYFLKDKKSKVVTITSTVSGEGKTFCAVNLATIFAFADKKTLLISLDLRKPGIHKVFNLVNDKGISTYLIEKHEIKDIIIDVNVKNLSIIPAGPVPPNPAELLESKRTKELFDYARSNFDVVIVDTPPISIVTDAILIKEYTDLYLFVLRHQYTHKHVVNILNELYLKREIKNMAILINDIHIKGYYGYSYAYGYGYGYGYSYGYYTQGYYDEEESKINIKNKFENFLRKLLRY